MAKKEALLKIKELIEDFERNKEYHLSKEFLENHCEEQFVKPFLRALGWDLESRGIAPYLREVITQDRVTSRKTKRAPDYGFRLPGSDTRLFFLEAKGAFVKLKTDKDAAHQARWYGRAGKTPITILFNFAEFAVYDCTQKQTSSSDAKFARIKYFTLDEYERNFDFIYDTFSREAIYNGNFQNFIKDKTQKKGNVTLDKDFVESLEKWRLKLAKNIAANNFKLNNEELNHAVQLLLDRIIFLRFCEERDVEPFGQLQSVSKSAHVYKNLFDLFYIADKKYNSGLFHFEDGCITEKLKVEDKTLREVIEDLYPPKSDYSFYLMPVEILGNAYEQFLGKIIRITSGHNIRIEEKPEVRKAGGVYYTPQYVVDYIVEQTVGKLIAGKTPKEIEKIKIVDPACGSGSFLLGAFKYLLNYHQNHYYKKSPNSKELNPDGTLTTIEKRKILTNNIFGVDLDENAVEVSKLSLLLKCMEGETASTVKQQITLHHTRVLPDLDKNIVNGNSLIGYEFTEGELDLDKEAKKEAERKVKPFEWKVAFPSIFKQGGFDAVVGNPPYVSTKIIADKEKEYYIGKYYSATGQFDLYGLFLEKGIKLLKPDGKLGFITSSTFLNNKDFQNLRELLLKETSLENIINFGETVFEDANLDVTVTILNRSSNPKNKISVTLSSDDFFAKKSHTVEQKSFIDSENYDFTLSIKGEDKKLLNKVFKNKIGLSEILDLPRGIEIGGNSEKIVSKPQKGFEKLLVGKNIKKYKISFDDRYIKFENDKSVFKDHDIYLSPKILIQRIRNLSLKNRIVATIDKNKFICTNTLRIGLLKHPQYSLEFILALLNSKLINYIFLKLFLNKDIYAYQLEKIPVVNFSITNFNKYKSQLEKLVSLLLELHSEEEPNQNKITHAQNQVDELVYEMYELSEEEINIVESANESN